MFPGIAFRSRRAPGAVESAHNQPDLPVCHSPAPRARHRGKRFCVSCRGSPPRKACLLNCLFRSSSQTAGCVPLMAMFICLLLITLVLLFAVLQRQSHGTPIPFAVVRTSPPSGRPLQSGLRSRRAIPAGFLPGNPLHPRTERFTPILQLGIPDKHRSASLH